MKSNRLKKLLLATTGMFAFQMAGCNISDQIQSLLGMIPGFGG